MKIGSIEGELRSNGASATQNCLGNTTADIFGNIGQVQTEQLAVEWFYRETIERFLNIMIHHFDFVA